MRPGDDVVVLLWLAADAVLFVGALSFALRDLRRLRWAPAMMRHTAAHFAWYALAVTALMVVTLTTTPGNPLANTIVLGVIGGSIHALPMGLILLAALLVTLPQARRWPDGEWRDG